MSTYPFSLKLFYRNINGHLLPAVRKMNYSLLRSDTLIGVKGCDKKLVMM